MLLAVCGRFAMARIWQFLSVEIRLNTFLRSIIPPKQFIFITMDAISIVIQVFQKRKENDCIDINETLVLKRNVRWSGYNVVDNWECETEDEEETLIKQFIPYLYPKVYSFKTIRLASTKQIFYFPRLSIFVSV